MISDRQLAAFAYLKAGISLADFPKHWALDTRHTHGDLTPEARAAYAAIAASYRPV